MARLNNARSTYLNNYALSLLQQFGVVDVEENEERDE